MESTCIDGYYMLGPGMSIKKRSNLVKVMKSAISISKSQTGDTVVRVNRRENRNKGENLLAVERMQTYSQITLDHSTRLFERKKRNLIKFHNDHSIPEPIRQMQSRYDELKEQMKMRQVSMWNKASDAVPELPELSSALTERLKRDAHDPHHRREGYEPVAKSEDRETVARVPEPARVKRQPDHPMVTQSLPSLRGNSAHRRRTQVVTRESVRKPGNKASKPLPTTPNARPDWCDKHRIYEFLFNQTQHQEAMLYKLRLDRWNTMMTEKEKVMNEKYPGDENHYHSVEHTKHAHASDDPKSDMPPFYSQSSNHTNSVFQTKSVDRGFPRRKKKFPLRKRVVEKLAMKKHKNKGLKGFASNKSVTFVE